MTRSKLNLIVDALLLLCLSAIAGIGFLIKHVLVPGFRRWEIYGRNVDLFFWGMDRHEWGAVHYLIARVLLALIVLHIVLHWKTIAGTYRRLIPGRALRYTMAAALAGLAILFLSFAVLVTPDVRERGRGTGGHQRETPVRQTQRY